MYRVRIIGPSGMERWLCRGVLKNHPDQAALYPHPSAAKRARDNFLKGRKGFITIIEDTRDPEIVVEE